MDDQDSGYNNGPPPPRWAWSEWNRANGMRPPSHGPTVDDYRREGILSGRDDGEGGSGGGASFAGGLLNQDDAVISPVIAAVGAMGLLWWLSRKKHP